MWFKIYTEFSDSQDYWDSNAYVPCVYVSSTQNNTNNGFKIMWTEKVTE